MALIMLYFVGFTQGYLIYRLVDYEQLDEVYWLKFKILYDLENFQKKSKKLG